MFMSENGESSYNSYTNLCLNPISINKTAPDPSVQTLRAQSVIALSGLRISSLQGNIITTVSVYLAL